MGFIGILLVVGFFFGMMKLANSGIVGKIIVSIFSMGGFVFIGMVCTFILQDMNQDGLAVLINIILVVSWFFMSYNMFKDTNKQNSAKAKMTNEDIEKHINKNKSHKL